MNVPISILEQMMGVKQVDLDPSIPRGILQTKNYEQFTIQNDIGEILIEFEGAKLANKCLPGDYVQWDGTKCNLELRDEHPLLVGTIELTNKSKYGLTSRKIPMYLFTPYDKRYPHFIVGCSEKDVTSNRIGLIKCGEWPNHSTFPRGLLQQLIGISGDYEAEYQALIWQACPWKYPIYEYKAEVKDKQNTRIPLSGYTFNIDPVGCRDVDDVFTFEKLDDKRWKVTITISDVACYLEDGDAIDILASLIGQTLYDVSGKVLRPMLPLEYSENACSLLPGKEAYGISLQMIWNGFAMEELTWFESIFTNNMSYTYEEFQQLDSPYKNVLQEMASYLAGKEITDSHQWVEQMMIFYNKEAGRALKNSGMGILRRHSEPNREQLERLRVYLPDWERLAFSSAEYCLAEEKDTYHYGLESDTYTHVSSPIRRYADIINQRVLKHIMNSEERYIVPLSMYDMNRREKVIKQFIRDMDFLYAISTGQTTFTGIIMEKIKKEKDMVKIKLYIPQWKRMISTTYTYVSENVVLSRDEKTELDVTNFREVTIQCAFHLQLRNWKERAIINISN
jgi:exoribonuclease R